MLVYEEFVADLAKRGLGSEWADYQGNDDYPSFIVRLSFVIGSFNLRDSWGMAGRWLGVNLADYEWIVFFRGSGGRRWVFLKNSQFR